MAQIHYKIALGNSYSDASGSPVSGSEAITFPSLAAASSFVETILPSGEYSLHPFIIK